MFQLSSSFLAVKLLPIIWFGLFITYMESCSPFMKYMVFAQSFLLYGYIFPIFISQLLGFNFIFITPNNV